MPKTKQETDKAKIIFNKKREEKTCQRQGTFCEKKKHTHMREIVEEATTITPKDKSTKNLIFGIENNQYITIT